MTGTQDRFSPVLLFILHVSKDMDFITRSCLSFFQHDGKYSFSWHDAVSGLLANGAAGMTFLADLCHLTQGCPDTELRSYREAGEREPLTENVFRKSPRQQSKGNVLLQAVYAFLCQQAHLPVPVSGVGVPHNAVAGPQRDRVNRVLLLAFPFADTYRTNGRLLTHVLFLLDNRNQKQYKHICIVCQSEMWGEKMRAMIAMSGGVDSSVAALLMQEAGFDCTGVTMRLYRENGFRTGCVKSCCSDEDEETAALVCWQLGIEHEALCFSRDFEQAVIRRFIQEYEAGRTPNPCIDCNRFLKFHALLERAGRDGFDVLATGHYARIEYSETLQRWQLFKALDEKKDQSYVLYMLTQEQLPYLRFPLGDLCKADARRLAETHGLVNAEKRDSQDICFIPDGDYAGFIRRRAGKTYPAGDILDQSGRIVGRHRGLVRYTIGQRRGLGVAAGARVYVIGKDSAHNSLLVGPAGALERQELLASDFNWLSIPTPDVPIRASVRTRYHQPEADASAYPLPGGQVRIVFDRPQRAITPGQAVVLYQGELVLGGGTICAVA